MKIKAILSSLLVSISAILNAQTIDPKKLDAYFEALEQNDKFMGSIAISSNNQIIYQKAVGFSDIGNNKKAGTDTKYKIGSVSKTFTAVLVFKAIEQQKLTLDTKLNAFYPTIKNAGKITIQNLLNHSSGIHNFTNAEDYLDWNTKRTSEKEILDKIIQEESDFEPNTNNQYSNSNYVLLSLILEKVFNQPYSEVLEKYISNPLNLENTYFGENHKKENAAHSYTYKETWKPEPETHHSIPLGAGAIVSTPVDLVHFINALFNQKLLNPKSLETMTTFTNHYGLGLFEMPYRHENHFGIGHDGAIDGFKSMLITFPNEKISFAITSNASNYQLNLITQTILDAVFKNQVLIPEFKQISFTEEELSRFVGTYSNTALPFKITIAQNDLKLSAQATGQSALPLEAVAKNIFTFDKAGIKLTFSTEKNTLTLSQSGQEFELIKE